MSRTSRWSKGLPPLRSLFGGPRPAARQREATLNIETLEERQVFAAPSVTLDDVIATATEGTASFVVSDATISDADEDIASMVVQLTGIQDAGQESLFFSSGSLSALASSAPGLTVTGNNSDTLTISGTGTAAQFEMALELIQYIDSSENPNTTSPRTFSVEVTDGTVADATVDIATASAPFDVLAVNDAPTVANVGGFVVNEDATYSFAAGDITIDDPDAGTTGVLKLTITVSNASIALAGSPPSGLTVDDGDGSDGTMVWQGTLTDLNAALGQLQYTPSEDDNGPAFLIALTVNDQGNSGGAANEIVEDVYIDVTAVADEPELESIESAPLAYAENDPATVVSETIEVEDDDGSLIASATISIVGGYESGFDVLAVVGLPGTWTASFDVPSGVLTITAPTGGVTASAMESVLRSVTFQNTSENPSTAARTIEFVVVDEGSALASDPVSRTVNVTAANDAPVLAAIETSSLPYSENAAPVPVTTTLTLTDAESNSPGTAAVRIATGFEAGADVLAVSGALPSGWTQSYDSANGILTITAAASATMAEMQAVLRAVVYSNTSENPSTAPKSISFSVTEASSGPSSNVVSRTINVTVVSDPPVLGGVTGPVAYAENAAAIPVAATITVADAGTETDAPGVATVSITTGFRAGDLLAASTTLLASLGWSQSYNSGTGVLTITAAGGATMAQMQSVLRSVSYLSTSEDPGATSRIVSFEVTEASSGPSSNVVTQTINVTPSNDAPVLAAIEVGSLAYTENGGPLPVTSTLTLTDAESNSPGTALVRFATGFQAGGDVLAVSGSLPSGWTQSYNATTGELTITAAAGATMAEMQTVLRAVVYSNTSENPSTAPKSISFSVTEASSGPTSNVVSRSVAVSSVNDAPVLGGTTAAIPYAENATAIPVASALTLSDAESNSPASATVSITSGFQNGADVLAASGLLSGWTQSYSATTGVLTITAAAGATMAQMQAALRSVTYVNTSEDPGATPRVVSFQVTETAGGPSSNTVAQTIDVTPANDAPVLAGIETGAISYSENAPATPVTSTLTLTDPDNNAPGTATVSITSGFQSGADVLVAASLPGGWTQSFNPTTGVLTITAAVGATMAEMQAALRSVTYENTSDAPTTAPRTISFSVTEAASGPTSNTVTRSINITSLNDAPVLGGAGGAIPYVENAAATPIASAITVVDAENNAPASATVTISSGFQSGADVLAVTGLPGGWTQNYNPTTGVLTITATGGATMAQMQTALRAVTFANTSEVPSTAPRIVSFAVTESFSGVSSNVVTQTINVTAVNDAPVLAGIETSALPYSENGAPLPVTSTLTVSDVENNSPGTAVVKFTAGFQAGADVLNASSLPGGWTQSYNATTGELTITAAVGATMAQMEAVLRAVTYANTSDNPTTAARTIAFGIQEASGGPISNVVTRNVTLSAVNDAPVIAGLGGPFSYLENAAPTPVAGGLTLTDAENNSAGSAVVAFSAGFQSGADVLAVSGLPTGWSQNYNGTTGELTITAAVGATMAEMQTVLRSLTFANTSDNPSATPRAITFSVTEASGGPSSGVVGTVTVNVTPVNDAPVLSAIETAALPYNENAPATPITSTITLTDAESNSPGVATISFTAGFQSGADVLGATGLPGGWTQNYNPTTGVLTITAPIGATMAQMQGVLRSVTYHNTSDNPTTAARTISFTVQEASGGLLSNAVTRNVALTAVNDPPVLTNNNPIEAIEGGTATITSADLLITDPEQGPSEVFYTIVTPPLPSSGTLYVNGSKLGIGGTFTQADVDAGLVTYKDNGNLGGLLNDALFTFTISDGVNVSLGLIGTISVTGVNDAPVLSGIETTKASYTENAAGTTVSSDVVLSDEEDSPIDRATVSITGGFQSGADVLAATGTLPTGWTQSYNSTTGVLTIFTNGFTPTSANMTAVLHAVQYSNTSDDPTTAVRTISITAFEASGGPTSNTVTRDLTVTPVNDAPTVVYSGTLSVNEDGVLTFTSGNITLGDVDAKGGQLNVKIEVDYGALSVSSALPGGLTIIDGSGADGSLEWKGTLADLNAALDLLVYTPNADYFGTDELRIVLGDLGNTGTGGPQTADVKTNITVVPVNDAPSISGPTSASVNEDTNLALNGAALITINDIDALSGSLTLTIALNKGGSLTLGTTNGLTGDLDGADGALTLNGTLADLNAALASLTYKGATNFNGSETLTVNLADNGNTGGGSLSAAPLTVAINVAAVNDAPTIAGPTSVSLFEDSSLAFTGGNAITIGDVDLTPSDTNNVTVTVSVNAGGFTIDLSGVAASDSDAGDGSVQFSGTLAEVNAALLTLVYAMGPDENGAATLSIHVDDNGNIGGGSLTADKSIAITVNPVNDAPSVTTPANVFVDEDAPYVFNGNSIVVSDIDAASGQVEVRLAVSNGTLTLSGAAPSGLNQVDADGSDGLLIWRGTLAVLNAALNQLQYQGDPDFFGTDLLSVTVNDLGNTGAGGNQVALGSTTINVAPVNDPPVVDLNGAGAGNDATATAQEQVGTPVLPNATIVDVDSANLTGLTITLTNVFDLGQEALSLLATNGLSFSTSSTAGTYTLSIFGTASVAVYESVLRGLVYTNASDNPTETPRIITVVASDGTDLSLTRTVTVAVERVNDAPTISAPTTGVTTDEDAPFTFNGPNAITISDVDATASGQLTVTLSVSHGTLALGLTSGLTGDFDGSDGSLTITGTLDDLNAALASLTYLGDPNYNTDFGPSETLQISVDDLGNTSHATPDPKTATASVPITVKAVNDPPVVTAPTAGVQTNEDVPFAFTGGNLISVADDATEGNQSIAVSLSVSSGTIAISVNVGQILSGANGSGSFVIVGTVSQVNAALASLIFTPATDDDQDASLAISVSDLGNTGSGGAKFDGKNVAIDVVPQNDPPTVVAPGPFAVAEDGSLSFSGGQIEIRDVDAASGELRVVLSVTNGTLTLSSLPPGLSYADSGPAGTLTWQGTLAALNAALDALIYTPGADYNGPETLHLAIDDLGNTGAGGAQTADVDLPIAVNAVNDAPIVTPPTTGVRTDEDTPITFSTANGNSIGIADVDAGSGSLTLTLSVGNGALTLGSTAGLTGDLDGSDGAVTITGDLTSLRAALEGLVYTPDANFSGFDPLTIQLDDLGNTGSGGSLSDLKSVTLEVVAINDAPSITLPSTGTTTNEDVPLVFSNANGNAITVADVDAGDPGATNPQLTVTLAATNGVLTAITGTGATILNNGSAFITISGSQSQINAALDGLIFTPDADYNDDRSGSLGAAEISLNITDNGNVGFGGALTDAATLSLSVAAVNDAPTISVPTGVSTQEDTPVAIGSIVVADRDAFESGASNEVQVTLTATNGLLTLVGSGAAVLAGNGSNSVTITGTVADVNLTLASLVFSPDANFNSTLGSAVVSAMVTDLGHSGLGGALTASGSVVVNVAAVNDAPTVSAPSIVYTTEDSSVVITGVTVNDVDAGDPGSTSPNLVVVLSAAHGTINLGAGPFAAFVAGNGTATLIISGTETDVNAALAAITFIPEANFNDFRAATDGPANVHIRVLDNANTGAGTSLIAETDVEVSITPVNDPPTITAPADFTTIEDAIDVPTPGFVIGDLDAYETGAGTDVQVTLTGVQGTLKVDGSGGATVVGSGGYVVVITGTVAQVNAALNTLKFSPDANFNDIHALVTGPARIDAVVSDLGNSGPAPSLPLTALESVTISVTPVNDAPLIVAPTDVNAVEDTTKPFVGLDGIFIDDPDANELGFTNPQLTVTLHVTHGVLNVGVIPLGNPLDPLDDTTVSGLGTSTLVISGLRDYVNASLASLTYTPEANFNDNVAVVTGPAVLSIDVSDNGNVGLGGAQHAYGSIVIHVEAVNDAPTITAPATATTNEDATVSIPGVSVADVDADEAGHLAPQMTVTLTAEHGTVKLLSLAGLTIDAGANDSATIAISGTISAINSALASLQFHPDADFNDNRGAARIHIDAQDNGNTGVGPLSGWSATRQTIDVSVAAVNDAPTIVVPAAQITNEDTPIVFSAGAGTQIVVGDVDAFESGATDQVVVTLTAVNGVLNLAAIGSLLVTGDGTGVVTLTGTLADVALALDGLTFSPTLHLSGAAQITVAVDDLGNTGLGGAKSDLKTIPITIIAVADDPTLSVATPIAGVEGTWIALPITAALVDLDGSETLSIVITNLPSNAILSAGVKNLDGSWTLTASQLVGLQIKVADQNDLLVPITGRTIGVAATAREASNGDAATTLGDFALTISNAPPVPIAPTNLNGGTLVAGNMFVTVEGTGVWFTGSFTDLGVGDAHTVEIDWGDGSPRQVVVVTPDGSPDPLTGQKSTYSGSHVYLDDSTGRFITVFIRDEVAADEAVLPAFVVQVDNFRVAPAGVLANPLYVDEQQPLKFSLGFFDNGIVDTFEAKVSFGDGNSRSFSNSQLSVVPGSVAFSATAPVSVEPTTGTIQIVHTYLFPGNYTMIVSFSDDDMRAVGEFTELVFQVIVVDVPGVGLELPDSPAPPPLLLPPVTTTTNVPLIQTLPVAAPTAGLSGGGQGGAVNAQQNEVPSTLKIQVVVERISRFRGKALGVEFTDILFANQINLVLERVGKLTPGTYRVTLSASGMPALVHEFSVAETSAQAAQGSVRTLWQEVQSREQSGGQNRGFQFLEQAQNQADAPVPEAPAAPQRSADAGAPVGDSVDAGVPVPDVTAAPTGPAAPTLPAAPLAPQEPAAKPSDVAAGAAVGLVAASALAGSRRRPSALERIVGAFRPRR